MTHRSIKPRVLLDGLAMVESPRWREGRLWFPHWGTLFMMANQFLGPDKFDEMLKKRAGQVLVAEAPAPGAGWP
jgi:hypothetical protein